jgi:hypothetical protein
MAKPYLPIPSHWTAITLVPDVRKGYIMSAETMKATVFLY